VTPAIVNQNDRRRVAGIATRTTNADEMQSSQARIPGLWGEFASQNWAERLGQGGAFGPTLAVYSAYESDASGSYQILIGREVAGSAPIAGPVHAVDIAPGKYFVFKFAGPLPGVVVEGWRAVWAFFERPDAPKRAYSADFEAYVEPKRVEIWIAV
jgi:predicted transcriptional regulator YdeE